MNTTDASATEDLLRANLQVTDSVTFEKILAHAPQETLEAIAHRVVTGSSMERNLYTDIFGVNQFRVVDEGLPKNVLLKLNATALTSHLIDDMPWFGWDAVRATMSDALEAVPDEVVSIKDMDAHRLRSAVLVNIIVDRSYRHETYAKTVDFVEGNYDAVYACLPALVKRHEGLGEINLGLVKEMISGIPLAIVEGAL